VTKPADTAPAQRIARALGPLLIAACVAVVGLAILRPLLTSSAIPAFHHDWSVPATSVQYRTAAREALGPWLSDGFGQPNFYSYAAPLHVVELLLLTVCSSLATTKLLLFGALLAAGCAAATTVRVIAVARISGLLGALIAALAFVASPYVANELGAGHVAELVALAGLATTLLLVARRAPPAMIASTVALAAVQIQLGLFAMLMIVVLWASLRDAPRRFVVALALAAFAFAGTLVAAFLEPPTTWLHADLATRTQEVNQSSAPGDAFTGLGYAVGLGDQLIKADPIALGLLGVLAVAAVIGLAVHYRHPVLRACAAVGLIALLAQMGLDGPAAPLVDLFFLHVPGAAIFRELYHFASLVTLVLALGLGAFVAALPTRIAWVVAGLFALMLVRADAALLSGKLATTIPRLSAADRSAWNHASAVIARDPGEGRILFVPTLQPLAPNDVTEAGTDPFAYAIGRHPALLAFVPGVMTSYLVDALARPDAARILSTFDVRYVVIRRHWRSRHYATLEPSRHAAFPHCSDERTISQVPGTRVVWSDDRVTLLEVPKLAPDERLLRLAASGEPLRASATSDNPRLAWVEAAAWSACVPFTAPLPTLLTSSRASVTIRPSTASVLTLDAPAGAEVTLENGYPPRRVRGVVRLPLEARQRVTARPSGEALSSLAVRRTMPEKLRFDVRATSSLFAFDGAPPLSATSIVPTAVAERGTVVPTTLPTWRYEVLRTAIAIQSVPWIVLVAAGLTALRRARARPPQ
jgi:hypothetical protein